MIVPDASVVAVALTNDRALGRRYQARLRADRLIAPELLDLEVLSAFRRLVIRGDLSESRAALAVHDLRLLRCTRLRHRPLLDRAWALRHNVRPYDGAYVALAEDCDATLVTVDARLANASGPYCRFELIA